MSSGFSFGANKPTEAPAFGQSTFGSQQTANSPFGGPTTNAASLPQFSSTFGGGTTGGFQFSSSAATSPSTFSTPTFNFNNPSGQPALKPTTLNFGSTPTPQASNLFGSPATSPPNTSTLFGTPKGNLSFNAPTATSTNPSFGFGTTTAGTAASTGGGLFGTAATTSSAAAFPFSLSTAKAAPTFGSTFNSAAPTSAPNTNLPFGSTTTSSGGGLTFGTSLGAPNTGLTFGTSTAAPSTGFSLGTASTGPTIGTTFGGGSAIPFGTTSTAPTAGISFGTASSTGSSFGTASTVVAASTAPATGINFGAPSAATPPTGINFGTATTLPNTGLNFAAATTAQGARGGGLTFGTPSTSATTGLAFAASPAVPKLPFGVGATITPAVPAAATTTGLSFGITKPVVPTAALGNTPTFNALTTSAPTLSFGTSLPSSTVPSLNFSAPLAKPSIVSSTTTPVTTATTTIGLTTAAVSVPAPAPALAPATGFTFGQTATSTTATTSVGLGGIKLLPTTSTATTAAATTAPSFNLLPQPTATTTTAIAAPQQNVGLGGISAALPKQPPTGTTITEQTETAPKDQPLPNELLQTVEHFKKFVQEQKSFSSEIARFSLREFKKVETDIDTVSGSITELENELQKNKAITAKLKGDTARDLQHAEMAQRTFDTPAGLQFDNTAPLGYFVELADNFEKDMYVLKVHIENVDKCVRNTGPPELLTSQDLSLGMRRLHETFVALAGRLQSVHNQVEVQKEQYLNLRKQLLHDYSNPFEDKLKKVDVFEILDKVPFQPPTLYTGPTPFNSLGNSQAQALAQNLQPSYPGPTLGATPTPNTGFSLGGPSTVPLFGSHISAGTPSLFNTSSSFQLQKPPIGNKRGKQ